MAGIGYAAAHEKPSLAEMLTTAKEGEKEIAKDGLTTQDQSSSRGTLHENRRAASTEGLPA
jgi:hypothetical protein